MNSDIASHFNDSNSKLISYVKDLNKHISESRNRDLPLFAVHGFCTDGGTSGAMIKHAIEEAAIIPLDYDILKHQSARPIIADLPWQGIVDLEPFNSKLIDFYVDHHISTVGKPINAKRIRFDANGDSGAWQLLESNFLGELPLSIIELAVMTRTTDTAGYETPPPIDELDSLESLNFTETQGYVGKINNEARIWLLDDTWGTVTTLKEHLTIINSLAADGFIGLQKFLPKVNLRRKERRFAYELADTIPVNSDIILFSYPEDKLDKFTILRHLQSRGAKVVISLALTNQGVKISLRRNRNLNIDDQNKIKLNQLAEMMNGGGHEGASGAFSTTLENALEIIETWASNLGYSTHYESMDGK